jgi:trehalose-6-phosphatase
MYKEIATSLALLMTLTGCDVKVHSLTSIKGACQLLGRQNLEKKMCANRDKVCIKHEVDCEATSYSSRVSVHSRKDWRAEADGRFEKPEYEDRINANFDAYKKWGIGDERFFIISDNKDDPTGAATPFTSI